MAKLDKGAKDRFDYMATMAVIIGGRPFSLFAELYIAKFVYAISANTYRALNKEIIGGALLNTVYFTIKAEVEGKLS
jgi:hypothetical protein